MRASSGRRPSLSLPARSHPPMATEVELVIGGMTCASCATRVEKKLNKLDGVTASVNYATEKAKVSWTGPVTEDDLVATVEQTGYTARLPEVAAPAGSPADDAERALTALRTRLVVSAVLTVPVIAMAMVPALQF